ncbi:MAG: S8 family serine peptidase [Nitrospirae bacterium]|nr:S8 family serine peptidase [Nitrospirota bacterium]
MKNIGKILFAVLVSLLVLGFAGTSFGQGPFVKDEIVVKFKPGVSEETIKGINQRQGTAVFYVSKQGKFSRLRVPAGKTVEELVDIYNKNPYVEYAEPNYIAQAFWIPNDPLYPYQWNFYNDKYGGINVESAWEVNTGDSSVVVAVIDTGVAYEDYIDTAARGRNRTVTYEQAPDLAETNFVPGYDFVNDDSHPNDDEGHGTHVTGTIAQSTNNNIGVAGIAFNTSIMPVKVLDSRGSGTYTDIADGIYFAANNGADIISMSLGGSSASITMEEALAYAYNKGVTIVAAAGNDGTDVISYPAAYNAYVIAVGATRYDETLAYYSNYGPDLDIVAPGGDTNVDQNGDGFGDGILQQTFGSSPTDWGYFYYQGTSMATPHVAGVAALVIASGVTGPDNVRQVLQSTAKDLGAPGWDATYGWGRVDAAAALGYTAEPVHNVAVTKITAPASALSGDTVSINVTAANPGDFYETFTLTLTDVTDGVEIGSRSIALTSGASTTETFYWDTLNATPGDHLLKASASVVAGETNTSDNSKTVTVTITTNIVEPPSMHIASIDMALQTTSRRNITSALATVTVADANGAPVAGATVSGYWSGATSDSDYGTTDAAGKVTLVSDGVRRPASGTTFTFTVSNVTLNGWIYNPDANNETSDSITVP